VVVVGAALAGPATAVHTASEGLSVIVFDARAYGGQAGESARIENYLGFPTGISGRALTGRAFAQAPKFGAEMAIPIEVTGLDCRNETACARTDRRPPRSHQPRRGDCWRLLPASDLSTPSGIRRPRHLVSGITD
jgi:thioredoxin reductase